MQAAAVAEPRPVQTYRQEARCRRVVSPEVATAVVQAMSDGFSRKIIASTIAEGKTIEAVSAENDIPVSTAYRRVHQLVDQGIIMVERIVLTPAGKRHSIYRSAFSEVRVELASEDICVKVAPNEDVAEKLYQFWQSMAIPK